MHWNRDALAGGRERGAPPIARPLLVDSLSWRRGLVGLFADRTRRGGSVPPGAKYRNTEAANMTLNARAVRTELADIQRLRSLYLQEMNTQIRYDACHSRGWTDSYLLYADDGCAGYGSIKGQQRQDRDTIFEFYVMPATFARSTAAAPLNQGHQQESRKRRGEEVRKRSDS